MGICKARGNHAQNQLSAAIGVMTLPPTHAATAAFDKLVISIPLSLYPDYDRRFRNRTGSADLVFKTMQAWLP